MDRPYGECRAGKGYLESFDASVCEDDLFFFSQKEGQVTVLKSMGWISLRVDSVETFLEKRNTESAMQCVAKFVTTSDDDQVACAACVVLANLIVTSSVACGSLRKKFKTACKEIIENDETWRKNLGPRSLSSVAQFGHSLKNIVFSHRSWPGAIRHLVELVSTLSRTPSRTKVGKSDADTGQGKQILLRSIRNVFDFYSDILRRVWKDSIGGQKIFCCGPPYVQLSLRLQLR